jgi:hypothetical protein
MTRSSFLRRKADTLRQPHLVRTFRANGEQHHPHAAKTKKPTETAQKQEIINRQ